MLQVKKVHRVAKMLRSFCLLIVFAWIWTLTACGGPGAEELSERSGSEEECLEEIQDIDPQAPGSPAARTDLESGGEWDQDMQQYFRQVTVQVQGPKYLGSGVIWDVAEDEMVIATAAHVTEDNGPLTVQFGLGEPIEARLSHASDQVDVAFLRVSMVAVEEQGITWQTARTDKEVCDRLIEGEKLLIMGSVEEAADHTYEGSVVDPWIYLEDFDNYMLLGYAYTIPGVSGGGVFTRDGILVGILCGGNDADEIAVLPWSVMEANSDSS